MTKYGGVLFLKVKNMKNKKKTIWDNIIIINCVLVAAMLLTTVCVTFLPNLMVNNYNPLTHYNYEVGFCSYVVTGANKQIVTNDKFLFDDSGVENGVAQSSLNATLGDASHVLIEYSVVNKSESSPLKAVLYFNNLTVENCNLEYSFGEEFAGVDSEALDLRIEPNSEKVCKIKISIADYNIDALCEGKFVVVLSIAKGE